MERFKPYAFREKFLMPVLEIIPNDIAKAAFINGWIIIHDRILRMFVKIIINDRNMIIGGNLRIGNH